MANSKEIRRRIKSVKNIGQITKALELVSASKMRKAQSQALASRPYARLASSLLENLAPKVDPKTHPLLGKVMQSQTKPSARILAIIISPDKGLAGALNTNLINIAVKLIQSGREKIDFITIGKKGTDLVRRMRLNIIATFEAKDHNVSYMDAKPITQIAIDEFIANHYGKVFVLFTEFVSTLSQRPRLLQILPLTSTTSPGTEEYLFEPNPDEVLEGLIQRTIEFAVYQSLVEAVASEHSARMVAMRNANTAASDLRDELQLTYNQARQSGITRELSEISAAKLAMEG